MFSSENEIGGTYQETSEEKQVTQQGSYSSKSELPAGGNGDYVGKNGEGAFTEDDYSSSKELFTLMDEVEKKENTYPSEIRSEVIDGRKTEYEAGILLVHFDRSCSEEDAHVLVDKYGGVWVKDNYKLYDKDLPASVTTYFPDALDLESLQTIADELKKRPEITDADINSVAHFTDSAASDSDSSSTRSILQWYLRQSNFENAWKIQRCDGKVTVAVLDSGFQLSHTDLAANFILGKDVVDGGILKDGHIDGDGHGTMVSGVISAVADNDIGVQGASYNTRDMPSLEARKRLNYGYELQEQIRQTFTHFGG